MLRKVTDTLLVCSLREALRPSAIMNVAAASRIVN